MRYSKLPHSSFQNVASRSESAGTQATTGCPASSPTPPSCCFRPEHHRARPIVYAVSTSRRDRSLLPSLEVCAVHRPQPSMWFRQTRPDACCVQVSTESVRRQARQREQELPSRQHRFFGFAAVRSGRHRRGSIARSRFRKVPRCNGEQTPATEPYLTSDALVSVPATAPRVQL